MSYITLIIQRSEEFLLSGGFSHVEQKVVGLYEDVVDTPSLSREYNPEYNSPGESVAMVATSKFSTLSTHRKSACSND